ncbi:MAG: hypothetical protein OXU20_25860 [Myxococcales bacterium]|nr:hypothetical protein [Myxococcales bacterium]
MGYALFQASLAVWDPQTVGEALAGLPEPLVSDLRRLVVDAHGVVADGLSRERAEAVADCLGKAGLHVCVGSDRWLHLPAPIRCRGLSVKGSAIEWLDVTGRTHELAAGDLVLLASGEVSSRAEQPIGEPHGTVAPTASWESASSRQAAVSILNVLAANPSRRFVVRADQFNYRGLQDDLAIGTGRNFERLIQLLSTLAPTARHNRGTASILSGAPNVQYPGQAAFDRESSYQLFHVHRGDEAAYPLPDATVSPADGIPDELRAALLALEPSPTGAHRRRPRRRWAWLAVQLLILFALLFWLSSVVSRLRPPVFE